MVGARRTAIFEVGGGPTAPAGRHRPRAFLAILATTLACAAALRAQAPRTPPAANRALQAIAEIEDGRGRHGRPTSDLVPLTRHPSPTVRAAAVRAMGRQQDPALLPQLFGALADAPPVRREAINALAQALKGAPPSREHVQAVADTLRRFIASASTSPADAGIASRTLGRLPFPDATAARQAEASIVEGLTRARARPTASHIEGALHGLYAIARGRRSHGNPAAEAIAAARRFSSFGRGTPDEGAARVRRLALLTLGAAAVVEGGDLVAALVDGDEQVRRLVAVLQAGLPDRATRLDLLRRALEDRSPIVRHEAVRGWRAFVGNEGCAPLIRAVGDANPHVALAAIDGMAGTCSDRTRVADTLLSLIDANRSDSPARARGRSGWHVHAHALVALARTDAERARPVVRREVRELTLWTVRAWAARAAAVLGDTTTLRTLANDRHGNVREVALGALATLVGHAADDVYLSALDAPEYHVVAEAAQALKGSPDAAKVSQALLRTLVRLTAEQRENSRDPRVALLDRIDELGKPDLASALEPYLVDIDSAVAQRAARIVSKWRGTSVQASPRLQRPPQEDLAGVIDAEWRATFVMSPSTGGGSFEVRLFGKEAPATVARFVRLARAGHYNGLTFHRVEPGFVIQGGSPAANEYVGDGPFMRDELGLRSHTRGTLGISTRGRDTGDAQLFVNLTDNFRLDHDYTVFGEIVAGRDVAEAVLEADVIARVDVRRVRPR